MIQHIPSFLTASRLLIAPLFAGLFIGGFRNHSSWLSWLCAVLLLVMEITDLLDGRLARRLKQVTNFGKIFDPLCDSLSRQTVFLSFLVTGIIPWWLFLLFPYRDGILSLLRIACAHSGVVQAARKSGKFKALIQGISAGVVVGIVLLHTHGIQWIPEEVAGRHPGFWVMLFPAAITVLSLFDYLIPNRTVLQRLLEPQRQK